MVTTVSCVVIKYTLWNLSFFHDCIHFSLRHCKIWGIIPCCINRKMLKRKLAENVVEKIEKKEKFSTSSYSFIHSYFITEKMCTFLSDFSSGWMLEWLKGGWGFKDFENYCWIYRFFLWMRNEFFVGLTEQKSFLKYNGYLKFKLAVENLFKFKKK